VAALAAVRTGIAERQRPLARAVAATGADVVASYQTIRNGFLVHATSAEIARISALPGVVAVNPAPVMTVDLARAVPFIGASEVWDSPGYDGTGTVVAVIDTGVDYTHADLGGAGTPAAYAANDPVTLADGGFPNEKVIGGYDLAGTTYTADPDCVSPLPAGWDCSLSPSPDPDPLDAYGHGTHVSGIVAGVGVPSGNGWRVYPGVAPGASIVALKVFGSPRGAEVTTDLADLAVEWVTSSNLGLPVPGIGGLDTIGKIDVINMSLGSTWGGGMVEASAAVDAALAAGVTVVASAGNDGDIPFITGAPASAPRALSVANTLPPGPSALALTATWEGGSLTTRVLDTKVGGQPKAANGGFAGQLADFGTGCDGPAPARDVDGRIAVIAAGTCPEVTALANAQAAGAIGVIMESRAWPPAAMTGAGQIAIPGVSTSSAAVARLQAACEAGEVQGRVGWSESDLMSDTISDSSSRGPARWTGALKPQISAPGTGIVSARMGTGSGSVALSGTSMASPMVAGVAALVWQRSRTQDLGLQPWMSGRC
jgi:subtilisin family serine protease